MVLTIPINAFLLPVINGEFCNCYLRCIIVFPYERFIYLIKEYYINLAQLTNHFIKFRQEDCELITQM